MTVVATELEPAKVAFQERFELREEHVMGPEVPPRDAFVIGKLNLSRATNRWHF